MATSLTLLADLKSGRCFCWVFGMGTLGKALSRRGRYERSGVMSPSSPTEKLLLVQSLRRSGHVVAATEEGTNDGPALHEV
ncbi:hypothetical protein YC2023_033081 [Brassica napus]